MLWIPTTVIAITNCTIVKRSRESSLYKHATLFTIHGKRYYETFMIVRVDAHVNTKWNITHVIADMYKDEKRTFDEQFSTPLEAYAYLKELDLVA